MGNAGLQASTNRRRTSLARPSRGDDASEDDCLSEEQLVLLRHWRVDATELLPATTLDVMKAIEDGQAHEDEHGDDGDEGESKESLDARTRGAECQSMVMLPKGLKLVVWRGDALVLKPLLSETALRKELDVWLHLRPHRYLQNEPDEETKKND